MGKQYKQKFRKEWLEVEIFKKWLVEVPNDSSKAHCKYCKCYINAKYADIQRHGSSKKHKESIPIATSNVDIRSQLRSVTSDIKTASCEASIATFLSSHCAVRNCDHLVDLCKSHFAEHKVGAALKMHRSKCSELINNVLSVHFKNDLVQDIGNGKYSLLLDESNDISVNKLLGMAVIYYSKNHSTIVSTYLSLVQLDKCDADSIVKAVKQELKEKKLDIKNLVAIGTDNASVMVGINNGVFKKLKEDVPSLLLIRCICHSLQLAVSHASAELLPRNLEFLIAETYKWFALSSVRQLSYQNLYKAMNDGRSPLKIPSDCQTRWLSIESAVSRILEQWLELKTHFSVTRLKEKCYTSEMLHDMYSDEKNRAYLLFLHPILSEIQTVNKLFESNTADQTKLLTDLTLLIKSISSKLVLPTSRVDPLTANIEEYLDPDPYLGYRFEKKIRDLKSTNEITDNQERNIRSRCKKFLLKLLAQLKQRLPDNIGTLKNASLLSVENSLKPIKDSIVGLMECMGEPESVIEAAEIQFKKINLVNWCNKDKSNSGMKYKDGYGANLFKEICEFAMKILVLPHSNADVERIFSQLNTTKSKLRNKMSTKTVDAILHIKYGLKRHGKCCRDYIYPPEVLKKIGHLESYQKGQVQSTDTTDQSAIPSCSYEVCDDATDLPEIAISESDSD